MYESLKHVDKIIRYVREYDLVEFEMCCSFYIVFLRMNIWYQLVLHVCTSGYCTCVYAHVCILHVCVFHMYV